MTLYQDTIDTMADLLQMLLCQLQLIQLELDCKVTDTLSLCRR